MKKMFLFFPLLFSTCRQEQTDPSLEVKRADPKDRVVAWGEPYLERHFDIVFDPSGFDEFCAAERDAGRVRLAKCPDNFLRRCVSNNKGQWVIIPDTPGLPVWNCISNLPAQLGSDLVDFSLPSKETALNENDIDSGGVNEKDMK